LAKSTIYRVKWTAIAEQDLTAIIEYVSTDSVSAALQLLNSLQAKALSLAHFPQRMRVVPELAAQGIERYRELIVSPYRIFCSIHGMTVYVIGVFDGRRDVEELLLQRLMMEP